MQKTKPPTRTPSTFISILDLKKAEELCMLDYKKYGDENTISTTGVPFTKIGTIGIYLVSVRYFRLFNQEPSWGFSLSCGGSMHNDSGYKTIQESFDACIAVYNKKEKMVGELRVFSNGDEGYNFPKDLQPLFDAMTEGKTIKSITCMGGSANKDNREKDFIIENFVATDYYVGFCMSGNEKFDNVLDMRSEKSFYMSWVLSFIIE